MACGKNGKANNGKPRPKKLAFLLPLFFSVLSFITPVNAENINLSDIPTKLGEALGIGTFAGQILMSGIFMLMFLLPICMLTRKGRGSWIPEFAVTLVIMGFCIAIAWLPYWFLVVLCMLLALTFSGRVRIWLTGGK